MSTRPIPRCGKCQEPCDRGSQRMCSKCHAANMRRYRAAKAKELETLRARVAELEALVERLTGSVPREVSRETARAA
jgi:Zn-dependent alcohol dehydrogenase